jgi:hypothetical protein
MSSTRARKVWRCRACLSQNVSIAVSWGETIEPVDQQSDKLEPESCGASVAHILQAFCNTCDAEGAVHELLERVDPMRGSVKYRRVESGWQAITIYALSAAPFHLNAVRSMDNPGWILEPCYVHFGVEQDQEAIRRANTFLDGYMGARDLQPNLNALKNLVRDICSHWNQCCETSSYAIP